MCFGDINSKEGYGYTESLNSVVVALCRDFHRRKIAVEKKAVSQRTAMEYRYINNLIYEGASEIVGEEYSSLYIYEIGEKQGYAYSKVDSVSESTYKLLKLDAKINIARKLHLID